MVHNGPSCCGVSKRQVLPDPVASVRLMLTLRARTRECVRDVLCGCGVGMGCGYVYVCLYVHTCIPKYEYNWMLNGGSQFLVLCHIHTRTHKHVLHTHTLAGSASGRNISRTMHELRRCHTAVYRWGYLSQEHYDEAFSWMGYLSQVP